VLLARSSAMPVPTPLVIVPSGPRTIMTDLPVMPPSNCILIYIGTSPTATGTALNQFYNYADYLTGDDCLVDG